MSRQNLLSPVQKPADPRLCNVSGYTTELLEICAHHPKFHVLFIPGNPGVVAFYKDFLESPYDLLGGTASITAIGHVSHTKKSMKIFTELVELGAGKVVLFARTD